MYAVTRSFLACCVTASPAWFAPPIVIDLSPLIDVVGKVPISPVTVVGPVFVMPAPARIAKLSAVPSGGGVGAASAPPAHTSPTTVASATMRYRKRDMLI